MGNEAGSRLSTRRGGEFNAFRPGAVRSHQAAIARNIVELGLLTIDQAVANSAEVQKTLLFLPGQLTDGIEQSDDPLIDVRNSAYAISFSRRNP